MSSQAQRIAIAEACGYRPATSGALGVLRWIAEDHETNDISSGVLYLDELPDYLNDLNAMHEAEDWLDKKNLMMEFANQLLGIVCAARGFLWDKLTTDDHLLLLSHATAAQRAEAFLRTIGKWKEASK